MNKERQRLIGEIVEKLSEVMELERLRKIRRLVTTEAKESIGDLYE